MVTMRVCTTAVLCLLILCAGLLATSASAERIYVPALGDGGISYSEDGYQPGGYAVSRTSSWISVKYEEMYGPRGLMISIQSGRMEIPVSSLVGRDLTGKNVRLNFCILSNTYMYLSGIRGNADGTITMADVSGGGPAVSLGQVANSPGWAAVDVTSYVSGQLASGYPWASFTFWTDLGKSATIAATEDSQHRGAYLEVVPEPSSLLALLAGISGLGGMIVRRRK